MTEQPRQVTNARHRDYRASNVDLAKGASPDGSDVRDGSLPRRARKRERLEYPESFHESYYGWRDERDS